MSTDVCSEGILPEKDYGDIKGISLKGSNTLGLPQFKQTPNNFLLSFLTRFPLVYTTSLLLRQGRLFLLAWVHQAQWQSNSRQAGSWMTAAANLD
jgi:hypothetical protein